MGIITWLVATVFGMVGAILLSKSEVPAAVWCFFAGLSFLANGVAQEIRNLRD